MGFESSLPEAHSLFSPESRAGNPASGSKPGGESGSVRVVAWDFGQELSKKETTDTGMSSTIQDTSEEKKRLIQSSRGSAPGKSLGNTLGREPDFPRLHGNSVTDRRALELVFQFQGLL
jgi:hypothetical protein